MLSSESIEGVTNLIVPSNCDKDNSAAALTASLMNITELQMNDIDNIALNADNLIQILQTIKKTKQDADEGKSNEEPDLWAENQPHSSNLPMQVEQSPPVEEQAIGF